MRRFSKIAAVALVGSLALVGCGSNSGGGGNGGSDGGGDASGEVDICKSETGGDGPKIGLAYDVGGRGDQSFNDSAYAGLERAVDELDATCVEANAQTDDNDQTRAERLRTLAEGGYNPVVAVGYLYSPAAAEVAPDYPDVDFAVIDGFSTTIATDADNLADLTFAENEGSYLVGVAAALKSENDHVGFVGGVDGALIQKFEAGFVAGVESVKPDAQIDVQYLTQDQNDAATGYENPSGGRAAAEAMYQDGADVVYHAAGKSGLGVFQAAAAAGEGNWAIGVDSDQYLTAPEDQQPRILTSMLKRIDTAVFEAANAVAEDSWQSGFVTYDLQAEGVGYSTSGGFVDDIQDQIDAAGEQIISGEIEVPAEPKDN